MFTRLCVDLDAAGHPIGCSYEVHDSDGAATIWVGRPGPFDTVEEALQSTLDAVLQWQGTQSSLF